MKENNYSHKYVELDIAVILVINFLNLLGMYEKKSGIPISKYFDPNEESNGIPNSSTCRFSSVSATSKLNYPKNNTNWHS